MSSTRKLCFCGGIVLAVIVLSAGASSRLWAQTPLTSSAGASAPVVSSNNMIPAGLRVDSSNTIGFFFQPEESSAKLSREEASRMIRYVLTAMSVPVSDLWVNLSPLDPDRVITPILGKTEMGLVMLWQDRCLKRLTGELLDPAHPLGQKFWDALSRQSLQRVDVSSSRDLVSRVWISPGHIVMSSDGEMSMIEKARLRVELRDHAAAFGAEAPTRSRERSPSEILMRKWILPEIQRRVNHDPEFLPLRRVYRAMILSVWYQHRYPSKPLSQMFAGRQSLGWLERFAEADVTSIYHAYLDLYQNGRENIREAYDPLLQQTTVRRYVTGGEVFERISRRFKVSDLSAERRDSLSNMAMMSVDVALHPHPKGPSEDLMERYRMITDARHQEWSALRKKDLSDPLLERIGSVEGWMSGTASLAGYGFVPLWDSLQQNILEPSARELGDDPEAKILNDLLVESLQEMEQDPALKGIKDRRGFLVDIPFLILKELEQDPSLEIVSGLVKVYGSREAQPYLGVRYRDSQRNTPENLAFLRRWIAREFEFERKSVVLHAWTMELSTDFVSRLPGQDGNLPQREDVIRRLMDMMDRAHVLGAARVQLRQDGYSINAEEQKMLNDYAARRGIGVTMTGQASSPSDETLTSVEGFQAVLTEMLSRKKSKTPVRILQTPLFRKAPGLWPVLMDMVSRFDLPVIVRDVDLVGMPELGDARNQGAGFVLDDYAAYLRLFDAGPWEQVSLSVALAQGDERPNVVDVQMRDGLKNHVMDLPARFLSLTSVKTVGGKPEVDVYAVDLFPERGDGQMVMDMTGVDPFGIHFEGEAAIMVHLRLKRTKWDLASTRILFEAFKTKLETYKQSANRDDAQARDQRYALEIRQIPDQLWDNIQNVLSDARRKNSWRDEDLVAVDRQKMGILLFPFPDFAKGYEAVGDGSRSREQMKPIRAENELRWVLEGILPDFSETSRVLLKVSGLRWMGDDLVLEFEPNFVLQDLRTRIAHLMVHYGIIPDKVFDDGRFHLVLARKSAGASGDRLLPVWDAISGLFQNHLGVASVSMVDHRPSGSESRSDVSIPLGSMDPDAREAVYRFIDERASFRPSVSKPASDRADQAALAPGGIDLDIASGQAARSLSGYRQPLNVRMDIRERVLIPSQKEETEVFLSRSPVSGESSEE